MRDLNDIVAANRDSYHPQPNILVPVDVFEKMVDALKAALNSFDDVLKHGSTGKTLGNINRVDRPRVERAIESAVAVLLRHGKAEADKPRGADAVRDFLNHPIWGKD